MSGRASPYMGTLVSALFAFGAHANIFSPLGCGSLLYSTSMTFHKSLILLLIFCWPISLRTPSCQVVNALSWGFPALLSFMLAPLTLHFSHIARDCLMSSHAEPYFIFFVACFCFTGRGRLLISYTCILALSIGMFHYLKLFCFPLWHSSPPSL